MMIGVHFPGILPDCIFTYLYVSIWFESGNIYMYALIYHTAISSKAECNTPLPMGSL